MSDQPSLSKFFGFCFVTAAIILFCVFAGGYTSFYRAQNRIGAAKTYMEDGCKYRLELLPKLVEMTKNSMPQTPVSPLSQAVENATAILNQVISAKTPLETDLVKAFENSQTGLTLQIKLLFTEFEASLETASDKNLSTRFTALKNEYIPLQDHLFVTRKRYNDEVDYFIKRTLTFPSSVFAKMYGFNKINHIKISEDALLPYHMAFDSSSS